MSGSERTDVAVIGGGSAGYAAARTAAAAGKQVVVIEGGEEVGGLCILRGCMPTKAFLYAAEVKHLSEHAHLWGMKSGKVAFDWSAVRARKDRLIREFADYRRQQLESFPLLRAQARFLDPHTVALSNGKTLSAQHFLVCTGSVIAPPPLPPLASVGYITSDDALKLEKLPRSMIVLGGGAVAVEAAQFFARFDVEITLIQRSDQLLRDFDPEAAEALENAMRREGMNILTATDLVDAYRDGDLKAVALLQNDVKKVVKAEEILIACGRWPNTASLDLEKAGVETEDGRIVTNDRMQTSASHIFAAGDCTSPHEIVHLAVQQAEIAARNITGSRGPKVMDYRLLIFVIFSEPQLASVGLTEKDAKSRGVSYLAASYPFSDHGKSLIMEARDGFVKLLADPQTGEILGGCCVGPAGGELIHEIVVAMAKRMTVHELAALPHYHPTLAEIWTYPAEELAERIGVYAETIQKGTEVNEDNEAPK